MGYIGRAYDQETIMPYPDFFDAVPRLRLKDPLAEFLGAFDDGEVEYGYLNVVKLAGHS